MIFLKKFFKVLIYFVIGLVLFIAALSYGNNPKYIEYGVTFSKTYSDELGLPWKDVYLAALDDLKIRKFRLVAYWPMIEPNKDSFNFEELDFQIGEAKKRDAEVILSIGRRLPRWPECHIPNWAKEMSFEEQKSEILSYLEKIVERYKSEDNIRLWQIENEPFLTVLAKEN